MKKLHNFKDFLKESDEEILSNTLSLQKFCQKLEETSSTFMGRTMDMHKLLKHSRDFQSFMEKFKKMFPSYEREGISKQELQELYKDYHSPNESNSLDSVLPSISKKENNE